MPTLKEQIEQGIQAKFEAVFDVVVSALPVAIQPYIEDRMHLGRRPGRRNTTDKLYVNTGRLRRALFPQKPGNVFRKVVGGTLFPSIEIEYGIDLHQVPYARIHELGGEIRARFARIRMPKRPYLFPAFEDFLDKALPALVKRALGQ